MCSLKIFLFFIVVQVYGQDFIPPGYEEITEKPSGNLGAIEKCGEGTSRGTHICVPYYQCDSETKTVIENGNTDGFGIIDIRFGEDKPCDHYLDICCKLPENGIIPSSSPETEIFEPPPPDTSSSEPIKTPDPWTCGLRNDNGVDFQITGNNDHEAEYGEFPWMMAIIRKNLKQNEHQLVCGGSLIASDVVLTGAHCVHNFTPNDLKVRAGEWDTQTDKERLPFQERDIKKIIIHEKFNPNVLFNDIALLFLDSPLQEDKHINTICLPPQNVKFDSKNCYATGWGKDKFGSKGYYQAIMKKLELPIVPNEKCQEKLRTTRLGKYFKLDSSFMCAGGLKELDTCTGDGGSPLACPDPNQPHRYVQAGIVAWGIGCGDEIPGVYVDVSKFSEWIMKKLDLRNDY